MGLLKKKIKGSTLVEALVALVIATFSIGIAAAIFGNVMSFNNYNAKSRAVVLLNKISIETKKEKWCLDEKIETDEFTIMKKISPYKNTTGLSALSLKAFDKSKKPVADRTELIITE